MYIHPMISDILKLYIETERNENLSLNNNSDFLLPGGQSNTPLSQSRIVAILREYNINPGRAFATSITNLLIKNNNSPALLTCGLGINIVTVSNYYRSLSIDNMDEAVEIDGSRNTISSKNIYFVYILRCSDSTYYTGYTSNLLKRISQHHKGTGSKYTKLRRPVDLVYYENFDDKLSAINREKQIKKLTVFEKEKLIEKSRME
ncbi:GIY-YIG nuclease family protein [Wukongibacter sp. M2B1]